MANKDFSIPYDRHHIAATIHDAPERFRVLAWGRRAGKSTIMLREALSMSERIVKGQRRLARGLVIAPTYPMVRENWLLLKQLCVNFPVREHESDGWMDLNVLGRVDFKSADAEGGVGRGAGYDWAIVDEAARIPRSAWEEDLRPALADRQGKALFGSTPTGRNWFYDLWRKGQPDQADGLIKSWRYSTWDVWQARFANDPVRLKLAEEEWKLLLQTTSQRTLAQEYLAHFLEQGGTLWSLEACLRGMLRPAIPGRTYIAGVDVARAEDWMAVLVIEVESRQVVALHRSQHRNWDLQKSTIIETLRQYPRVHTLIDSTGVGSPIAQDFRNANLSIEEVIFSAKVKKNLVDHLGVILDHGKVGLPDEPATQWLLDELRDYQELKTPAGNVRWSAPEGKHDDGVTALMLAAWGMRFDFQQPTPEEQPVEANRLGAYQPEALLAYTINSRHWEQQHPNEPVPTHPHSLAWQRHRTFQRYAKVSG